MMLFCAIVGVAGSAFSVEVNEDQTVEDLKKAIADNQKFNFANSTLQLFLAKKHEGAWLTQLDVVRGVMYPDNYTPLQFVDAKLRAVGLDSSELGEGSEKAVGKGHVHVLVLIPSPDVGSKRAVDEVAKVVKRLKLIAPKTLTEFILLSVPEKEFQLDNLQSDDPIVMTPALHEFWKGFGEFPPCYFVRMEQEVLWKVMKKLLFGKDRVVIVGSPGVGKSCFLMLLAFYLACAKRKKVLVIRRLKTSELKNVVVYLDGLGSYSRLTNLSSIDIVAIRRQTQGAIVLVDGFNQAEVDDANNELAPFHFLATSCEFDAEPDDNSHVVVLPAWRYDDLLQYAKLTNWVVETGLRWTKQENTPITDLAEEQYFYSGGSLREFCKERGRLKRQVAKDCRSVGNDQALELERNYGERQSKSQVDTLRRHFITDCSQEADYYDSRCWRLSVDSKYVKQKTAPAGRRDG
ncbi:hypothetical protein DVH05_016545 [Phytophthora capsici]|nr:hypothetical protein DVH05_016545 [Phytophthora capsici]